MNREPLLLTALSARIAFQIVVLVPGALLHGQAAVGVVRGVTKGPDLHKMKPTFCRSVMKSAIFTERHGHAEVTHRNAERQPAKSPQNRDR